MNLGSGARVGPYEILAPLGAGGMGEVWRARDTRLERDVAIKALPEAFARDPDRLARFEREAKLLASLNHPNIASIYGQEEVDRHRYLVLEHVEGETLAERLDRGPLPIDEALDVGRQIAAGVEAAHESGVVHRDLKPRNIKLTPAGQVKVLDFGLARGGSAGSISSDPNLSESPTMTYAATSAGMILGTAPYMSPEQARGRVVDRRTDIWSFGCVLYECFTGRQLYEGDTVSDLIAKILEREPDWSALPANVPPRVRQLLERCLRKDPRERLRDIGDARLELAETMAGGLAIDGRDRAIPTAGAAAWVPWVIVGMLAVALAGTLAWLLPRAHDREVMRLGIAAPSTGVLAGDPGSFALAPDGRSLVFALDDTTGVTRLWLRRLGEVECRPLPGTEDGEFPFWSPDSRHVAFFAGGKVKRVPAAGGAVQTITVAPAGRGGSWSPKGVIVFAPETTGPLQRVDASGGEVTEATVLDTVVGEYSHRFPQFLPDGHHFIYGASPQARGDLYYTHVASLEEPHGKPLVLCTSTARFAPPGYLVFGRNQALLAQRLDLGALKMVGEPILLREQPILNGLITMAPVTSFSSTGAIAYGQEDRRPTELWWVDRTGRRLESIARHPGLLTQPAMSPTGDRLAVSRRIDDKVRIWIFDLARGTNAALPSEASDYSPVWSPDGRGVACVAELPGLNPIPYRDAGGGGERVLVPAQHSVYRRPTSWLPDGRTLLLWQLVKGRQRDIMIATAGDSSPPRTWIGTPAMEEGATCSHDGQWIAYVSDRSGRRELFVDAFPRPNAGRQVSTSGVGALAGEVPVWWRRDDRELYFIGADGMSVYACDIHPGPDLTVGSPRRLFTLPSDARGVAPRPDGQRFVLLTPVGVPPTVFTFTQNWTADLGAEK